MNNCILILSPLLATFWEKLRVAIIECKFQTFSLLFSCQQLIQPSTHNQQQKSSVPKTNSAPCNNAYKNNRVSRILFLCVNCRGRFIYNKKKHVQEKLLISTMQLNLILPGFSLHLAFLRVWIPYPFLMKRVYIAEILYLLEKMSFGFLVFLVFWQFIVFW